MWFLKITFVLLLILLNLFFGSTLYIFSPPGSHLTFIIYFHGCHKAFERENSLNCRNQKVNL